MSLLCRRATLQDQGRPFIKLCLYFYLWLFIVTHNFLAVIISMLERPYLVISV